MKLYLHVGTEKTGSSFLQSYLANQRDLLCQHGFFFPKAGIQEANMQKGIITPGNAWELNEHLQNESWKFVEQWLEKRIQQAFRNNCDKLLLSNEILINTFSKDGVLKQFLIIINKLGFEIPEFLLIIREPVSQALSLYKHRSKDGFMLPINKWLKEKYILADSLQSFYSRLNENHLKLLQYPYKKNSTYLVNVCTNQWLGLNEKIEVENRMVNPSLTLSELSLLSHISTKDEFLAKKYYSFMLDKNSNLKADDVFFEEHIKNHINNFMVQYNSLWKIVNSYMSTEEALHQYKLVSVEDEKQFISFSENQTEQLSEFIKYISSIKYLKIKVLEKLKNNLLKIIPDFIKEIRKKAYRT